MTITFIAGCNSETGKTAKDGDVLKVYTTVYPLLDFTKKIGGKYVNVETVYPAGTDEHSFEPTQKDIIKMADSDLFFYIGYNLEGFVTKAKPILEQEDVTVKAIGETVAIDEHDGGHEETEDHAHEQGEDDGHNHGSINPHLWLDPIYANEMAASIKEELINKMPEQKEYFEKNYQELEGKLTDLDNTFKEAASFGTTHKIIVSHAAYGYWEERYGIEQISVAGLSSSSEPTQKQLENIIKTAEENKLRYVIFEQNTSSKLTKIIQKEIGAKPLKLHNLSILTDKDIDKKEDYFSLMESNANTLKTALSNQ
ncbi:metal ABC transporter solute-binding protein, Zn/Mn family [Peribacillus sp. SCS-155]|uniref:metal ABC transporter solute-binding protein, Zn/Mn family n=1 Tax=Peribacillus sedimenti TaxID=3115297 RepID=UPI003906A574